MKVILVVDGQVPEKLVAQVQAYCSEQEYSLHTLEQLEDFDWLAHLDTLILLCIPDARLKAVFPILTTNKIGLLPHPEAPLAMKRFKIPAKVDEALLAIFEDETPKAVDHFYCNDELVLSSVLIGDRKALQPAGKIQQSVWARLIYLWGLILHLVRSPTFGLSANTQKASQVHTAAMSLALVYRPEDNPFTHRVVATGEQSEPSLHAIVFAPRSISEVWHFALTRLLPLKTKVLSLPSYLGHIKSQSLQLGFPKPVEVSVDGQSVQPVEVLDCRVVASPILLHHQGLPAGRVLEPKESFRVSQLPKGKLITDLIARPLPWIYHSDPEEIKETFVSLKESARLSPPYLVLMALSVLLATVGLFANSAPVIIGAMILAPLMAPIISLSMGALRQEIDLILTSSRTLVFGVLLALLGSTMFAWLVPLQSLNSEISARLSPTILDLMVAIIAGIAGAYANAKSEVAKSMAGVAIAVALVPPLAVSGIGIGWWDWHVFSGAFLLFLTNLFGIVLAGAVTFLVLGFSPLHLAKRGLGISLVIVLVVSVPLSLAFYSMVTEQRMVAALESTPVSFLSGEAVLREVSIRRGNPLEVSVTLVSDRNLAAYEIDQIKQQIELRLEKPIRLEATLAIVR